MTRGYLSLAGAAAGIAGIAVSHAVTLVSGVRATPVVAVAEAVIEVTPGGLAETLISLVGQYDKPLLIAGVTLAVVGVCAWAGAVSQRSEALATAVFALLALVGGAGVMTRPDARVTDLVPVLLGAATWVGVLAFLRRSLQAAAGGAGARPPGRRTQVSRRRFLTRMAAVTAAAGVVALGGELAGRARRTVEASRRLLRLPVTQGRVPAGVSVDVDGVGPWRTSNEDFYRIDTALVVPGVDVDAWQLRIHGMVEREVVVTYRDLLGRQLTEGWVTLCCVSNEVGGELIGNAWWSGVRVAELLAEAGVSPQADAVLQTSEDGWTCGTPLAALTDDRNALLAIAMNGEPLPLEHGFPVRMVVPGLYGYVSATKWLVDLEVSRFDRFDAYWTERGWAEQGPVRTQSRIDVPRSGGRVAAGTRAVGGSAWAQHTGVAQVEYRLDGHDWQVAELGRVPNADTWVQWRGTVDVAPGEHTLAVRATDRSGYTQTSVRRDVVPDGATGWHTVSFSAE